MSLPSNTKDNSREHLKAISLRSGEEVEMGKKSPRASQRNQLLKLKGN